MNDLGVWIGKWHSCGEKVWTYQSWEECGGCGKTWGETPDSTALGDPWQDRIQPKG